MIQRVRELLPTCEDSLLHAAGDALTSQVIFAASDAGDDLARRIAGEAVKALGKALVNLINVLNPEVIVVGGGVFADGWLLPRLCAVAEREALRGAYRTLRGIVPSTLHPEWVGLLGAATLAWGVV
jgi:glucokinase